MATTNPGVRITSGVKITSGYQTVNGLINEPNAYSSYFAFINANSSATGFQITEYGFARGSLASAATVELDLFDGTLKNRFNESVVFNNLKFAAIFLTSSSYEVPGTTGQIRIGNAASNGNAMWFGAIGNTQTIYPGGLPFLQGATAGVTVNTSLRKVKLENTHGSETVYYVALFGGLI